MARPRRSEQTRTALIQAGIEQLSAQGYHGTGIKQILDAVQVPKGSFYNYFASKEAFVAEIVREYSDRIVRDLDAFLRDSDLGPVEKLQAVFVNAIEKYEAGHCQKGCLIGSLAAEIGSHSDLCQQAMQQAASRWEQRIATLLSTGQEAGEVRGDLKPEQLARMVWSCWEGALLRMKMDGNSKSARDIVAMLPDTILRR